MCASQTVRDNTSQVSLRGGNREDALQVILLQLFVEPPGAQGKALAQEVQSCGSQLKGLQHIGPA